MALEPLIATIGTVFASSAFGSVVGALITQSWTRRTAKKVPKTTERPKVYEAIIVHLVSLTEDRQIRLPEKEADLRSLLGKLALYGESNVVEAMARFFAVCERSPAGVPASAVVDVVREMRMSLLTGADTQAMQAIEKLLAVAPTASHESTATEA